ncbi:hypothetical protein GCM10009425_20630 [Pseudomonas asuensis]|uniref:Secreted protein n=1 Tax=Pseudomonas asuensis TaxID=1825787 RepID=A0ABQ2GT23_9PSED|nr:hypothetical protein GCM10009425_20630 [Pseudomonas asuensis]
MLIPRVSIRLTISVFIRRSITPVYGTQASLLDPRHTMRTESASFYRDGSAERKRESQRRGAIETYYDV